MANLMSRTFNPQFKLTLTGAGKENVEVETSDPCDFQHAVATIFFSVTFRTVAAVMRGTQNEKV